MYTINKVIVQPIVDENSITVLNSFRKELCSSVKFKEQVQEIIKSSNSFVLSLPYIKEMEKKEKTIKKELYTVEDLRRRIVTNSFMKYVDEEKGKEIGYNNFQTFENNEAKKIAKQGIPSQSAVLIVQNITSTLKRKDQLLKRKGLLGNKKEKEQWKKRKIQKGVKTRQKGVNAKNFGLVAVSPLSIFENSLPFLITAKNISLTEGKIKIPSMLGQKKQTLYFKTTNFSKRFEKRYVSDKSTTVRFVYNSLKNRWDIHITLTVRPKVKKSKVLNSKIGIDLNLKKGVFLEAVVEKKNKLLKKEEKLRLSKTIIKKLDFYNKENKQLQQSLDLLKNKGNWDSSLWLKKKKNTDRFLNIRDFELKTKIHSFLINQKGKPKYDLVVLEDLKSKNFYLKGSKRVKYELQKMPFYQIITIIENICLDYNITLKKVKPEFTSQTCHVCNKRHPDWKGLSNGKKKVEEWLCPNCNSLLNRDRNAAINILRKGS